MPQRWPEATVETALGAKNSPARLAIHAQVDRHGIYIGERILDSIAEGMRDGERWTATNRCLVSPQEAARRLGVDYEEREDLCLRSIGAVDSTPEVIRAQARDKKLERDRAQKETMRRAGGAQPREEYERNSASRTRPWEALGISRRTYYRRLKEADGRDGTSPSLHNKEPYGFLDNSPGDGLVPRPTPTDDFSIDRRSSQAIGHPSSLGNSSDSEKTSQLAALAQNIAQRLSAPGGADCGRPNLSLSELALLALYMRERSSGRIREAAR
ncbi:MAG: hypothetical protein ACR65W_03900 [Methylocystis sp.]|uniref:hypothetical protein n=1 Tax=Methylocystis sp. TaxID=1911079 RepID=UPI003DA27025